MNKAYKRINILIIIFSLFCFSLIIGSVLTKSTLAIAQGEINYNNLVYIKNSESGYELSNVGGTPIIKDDTLTNIIKEIVDNNTNNSILLSFSISGNEEEVVLNVSGGKTLSFSGEFTSIRESGTVFTLQSGSLQWSGLTLRTLTQGLKVNYGAAFTLNAGNIIVNSATSSSAVEIQGIALIKGTIEYSEASASFGYGLYVDTGAVVTINDTALIEGHSAVLLSGELNVKNAINIKANKTNNYNTSAGYALRLIGSGYAKILGGNFSTEGGNALYLAGDSSSNVELLGGSILGGIKISSGVSTTKLKFNGKYYKTKEHYDVTFNSQSNTFTVGTTLWEDIVITASSLNQNGFRLAGWEATNGEEILETKTDVSITANDFEENATITPKESNFYTIKYYERGGLYIEEEVLEYATLYDLSSKSSQATGFEFLGWSTSCGGAIDFTDTIVVDNDYSLYKVEQLIEPIIIVTEAIDRIYDQSQDVLSVQLEHVLADISYVYNWQKKTEDSFEDIINANESSLNVKNVADSGIYRVKITMTYLEDSRESCSDEIQVSIAKASFVDISYDGSQLAGVYDKDKTLSNFVLGENYYWNNPEEVPTCGKTSYDAYYNNDFDNYNSFSLLIPLELTKATYDSVEKHQNFIGFKYDPNKTLASYLLSANYYWENPSETPQCGKTVYDAYYNDDFENYENKQISITIQLGKIDYPDSVKNYTMSVKFSNVTEENTLSYIQSQMQPGYSFNKPLVELNEKLKPRQEAYVFLNCYYDYDSENYNKGEGVIISIFIEKGDYPNKTHNAFEGVYDANQTLKDFQLDENYIWANPDDIPTCDVKLYKAKYRDENYPEYYNELELSIEINLAKGEYIKDTITLPEISAVYSPNQTLSSFSLLDGFRWSDPEIVPTVQDGGYETSVIYNEDCINYNDCLLQIKVKIAKANYDISDISLPNKTVIYDGMQHFLAYTGILPSGVSVKRYNNNIGHIVCGIYPIDIEFEQEDEVNYYLISHNIKGILTISRAPSIIIADERQSFVYDGNVKSIKARVANTEQTLIYSKENKFKDKGSYSIILQTTASTNFGSGYKEVFVFINSKIREIGDVREKTTPDIGEVAFGIIDNPSGIECDVDAHMEFQDTSVLSQDLDINSIALLNVSLTIDGQPYEYREETYKITMLMPTRLIGKDTLRVYHLDDNGNAMQVTATINGKCLIIESEKLGNFVIEDVSKPLKWWEWLLISIAIAVTATVATYFILRYKAKVFGKDTVKYDIIKNEETYTDKDSSTKEEND